MSSIQIIRPGIKYSTAILRLDCKSCLCEFTVPHRDMKKTPGGVYVACPNSECGNEISVRDDQVSAKVVLETGETA